MFENYIFRSWENGWAKGLLYLTTLLVIALLVFMKKKHIKFSYRVITGMVLGILVGFIFGQFTDPVFKDLVENGITTRVVDTTKDPVTIVRTIRPIGQLYLRLIQMVAMPLVLTAVIKSFTSLSDVNKLKRIGGKTLMWLLGTTAIATLIGYGFAAIFGLGKEGFIVPDTGAKSITMIENVILGFFPNNIITAMSGNVAIPVVVFGIFVSVAIIVESKRKPERMKPFLDFNESFNRIIVRVTKFVIQLTPYAVFSFMAYAVARNNLDALKNLGIYIGLIYAAMIFHFVFIQMGLLAAHRISPIQFIKKFSQAMVVAFTTQSSYGTLPVTQRTLKEKIGASEPIVDFVTPIGANVGMNACGGIFPAMVAVITANAMGINFGIVEVIILVLVTTIASIGIAGVPGIATIAATVTLSALGLPLEGIALVTAVDALVDMGRTMINVVGTGVAATLVAKSENELNMEIFNAPLEVNKEEV